MRIISLSALAMLLPITAPCQSLPRLTFDVTAGAGQHATTTAADTFKAQMAKLDRFALGLRLGKARMVTPYLVAEASPGISNGFETGTVPCVLAGTCSEDFINPSGWAVGLSARMAVAPRTVAGLSLETAKYERRATVIGAEVGLRAIWRFAVIGDLRLIESRSLRGQPTWFAPFSAGLRLQ